MQLTKFAVIGLVIFAMTWRSGSVVAFQSPEDLSVVADLAYIMSSCYRDRIRGVGLAGNLPDTLARTLSTQYLIPVALIDGTLGYSTSVSYKPVQFHQGLQVFIVEASSLEELSYIIDNNIRGTIWWNHIASFFILDRSPKCGNAIDFLYASWVHNLLNAKVICYHFIRGRRLILNYNPYTTKAPAPWKLLDIFRGTNNHPFTVFVQVYTKIETICVNLDFDKTKNLGGYEISIEGTALFETEIDSSKITRNIYRYRNTRDRVLHNIFCSLNAKPKFTPTTDLKYQTTSDMRQSGRLMMYVWAVDKITYPHKHFGFILVSKFRGHKTQLEKILCVIDVYSRYGMGIVYFVTLIFLKFFVGQALIPALLNLVRITCDTGFTNLPDTNAPRIFLTCLLFFVVTMQGIYQGNLAALLTTNIPHQSINVIKDVVDLDYKLYGNEYMINFIKQYPELEGRFRATDLNATNCIAPVMADSSAVCLWLAEGEVLDLVEELELHTSSEFVATVYSAFEIRWDWPPEQRVNIILSRLVEADVILPWNVKCKPLQLTDYKYDKEVKNNKDFKVIELTELTFAFVIFAIGLVSATVVFIVEVAIAPIQIKNRQWVVSRAQK